MLKIPEDPAWTDMTHGEGITLQREAWCRSWMYVNYFRSFAANLQRECKSQSITCLSRSELSLVLRVIKWAIQKLIMTASSHLRVNNRAESYCTSKHGWSQRYCTHCSVSYLSSGLMWELFWRKGNLATTDGLHVPLVQPFVLSAWFSGILFQTLYSRKTVQQRKWHSSSGSSLYSLNNLGLKGNSTDFTHILLAWGTTAYVASARTLIISLKVFFFT